MNSTAAALVQPAAAPAASVTPRLVPALVNGQQVYIPCPTSWCVTDHVAENERHLEDIAHCGALTDLVVPGEPGYRLLAHARLGADLFAPESEQQAPFVVIDDRSEMFHLSPDEADVFADRLTAFAEQVRALARIARR
jgi:hypothetical protein